MNYYKEEYLANKFLIQKNFRKSIKIFEEILKDPNSSTRNTNSNSTKSTSKLRSTSFFIKQTAEDENYKHLISIPNAYVYFRCAGAYAQLGNYEKVNEMLNSLNKLNWIFWRWIRCDTYLEPFRKNATGMYIKLLSESNNGIDLNMIMMEIAKYKFTITPTFLDSLKTCQAQKNKVSLPGYEPREVFIM